MTVQKANSEMITVDDRFGPCDVSAESGFSVEKISNLGAHTIISLSPSAHTARKIHLVIDPDGNIIGAFSTLEKARYFLQRYLEIGVLYNLLIDYQSNQYGFFRMPLSTLNTIQRALQELVGLIPLPAQELTSDQLSPTQE